MKQSIKITTTKELKIVFDTYYRSLVNYGSQFLLSLDESKDVVQEVFIILWDKKMTFNSDTALRAYLYSVVKNKCLNIIKHEKVKEKYSSEMIQKLGASTFSKTMVQEEEVTRQLYKAIAKLPLRKQEVIKLTLKEFKNNEIAERMDIQLQTVKTLKSQAYTTLRNYFKELKF